MASTLTLHAIVLPAEISHELRRTNFHCQECHSHFPLVRSHSAGLLRLTSNQVNPLSPKLLNPIMG